MVDRKAWSRRLHGALFPAVPVPFRADDTFDAAAQDRYVAYMKEQNVTGVAVWAHTGRGLVISRILREKVLKAWRAGLSPEALIVAGAGGATDDEAVAMARDARAWGADALLVYAPVAYRGLPHQDRLVVERHRRLSEVGLPMILFYLYEAAGGISYSLEVLKELFALPGVVGIKMATLRDVMVYQDVAALIRQVAPDTTLITGEDRFLGYSVMCGATAALIGMGAAAPRFQHDLLRTYLAGDHKRFVALSNKADALAQVTFIPPMEGYIRRMLWCLVQLGVIPADCSHDPWGPPVPPAELDRIATLMREIGEL
ncbi:MAG TPA: dihydrodipicolinate synthase family protein [Symbiobacteriaceae bacterium]|nr:dihydrodipicolinate synthase family protein [Symbiobacteriaceae bacterium]